MSRRLLFSLAVAAALPITAVAQAPQPGATLIFKLRPGQPTASRGHLKKVYSASRFLVRSTKLTLSELYDGPGVDLQRRLVSIEGVQQVDVDARPHDFSDALIVEVSARSTSELEAVRQRAESAVTEWARPQPLIGVVYLPISGRTRPIGGGR